MNPEPKTVTDLTDPDRALDEMAGVGGAPPASQPEPAPTPEVEGAEGGDATEAEGEAEAEGEVPEATEEGG